MSEYSNIISRKAVLISFMETDVDGNEINWSVKSCVSYKLKYNVKADSDMGDMGMSFVWDGKVGIVAGLRGVGSVESDIVAVEAALAQLKMDLVASKSTSVVGSGAMGGNAMSVYWSESEDVTEPTMVVYIPSGSSRLATKTVSLINNTSEDLSLDYRNNVGKAVSTVLNMGSSISFVVSNDIYLTSNMGTCMLNFATMTNKGKYPIDDSMMSSESSRLITKTVTLMNNTSENLSLNYKNNVGKAVSSVLNMGATVVIVVSYDIFLSGNMGACMLGFATMANKGKYPIDDSMMM